MNTVRIGNKTLGLGEEIFLSAEVGTTCNGEVGTAKKLIDAAVDADLDAIKFQILNPDDKFADKTISYSYTRASGEKVTENMYEMLKQYVMAPEEWADVKHYADEKGIIMFATPDYIGGVDLMEQLNMPAYKIATWDVTFYPMVEKIAKLHKPAILDFGASDEQEIERVLDIFKKEQNDKLVLLHCYHTSEYGEMNLRTIEFLRERFGYLSGFSASDEQNEIDYMSLAFRPVYVEKRLTLNRQDPRHHHSRALEPPEMKEYGKRIHELSRVVGDFVVKPSQQDLEQKNIHFRKIVATRDMQAGENLSQENIACRKTLKPGMDALLYPTILGRELRQDVTENEPITEELIS